jgi:hypothetical protein
VTDATDYKEHAAKIRRLVAGVRGHAATAALLLADEYEARASELEGKPAASAYLGNADRIGELVAGERAAIETLIVRETELTSQLARARQERRVAEARIDAILTTARLLDMPEPLPSYTSRYSEPAKHEEHAAAS